MLLFDVAALRVQESVYAMSQLPATSAVSFNLTSLYFCRLLNDLLHNLREQYGVQHEGVCKVSA